MNHLRKIRRVFPALLVAVCAAGCGDAWEDFEIKMGWRKPPPEPEPASRSSFDPLFDDTLAAQARVADIAPLRIRGFGLVVGLGENGSSDAPSAVRNFLIEQLNRQFDSMPRSREQERPSAARLVDSLDSAAVEVTAVIPPGAPRGSPIDVYVQAIPGTQARSLDGGLLLPCELRLTAANASGAALMEGRVMARAGGPVFVNPFSERADGAGDPRRGLVLGGGINTEARPARILLSEPSYSMARRVEQRVNERFGQRPRPTAEAMSSGFVMLHTPAGYADRPSHFLALIPNLYVESGGGFIDRKLMELAAAAIEPEANLERIALVWEAMGRVAIPQLQRLYAHEEPAVSFYASRAGLRLRDTTALEVMKQIATTTRHPFRAEAARELSESEFPQALLKMVSQLDSDDLEIRLAAHRALSRTRHAVIQTTTFRSSIDPQQVGLVFDVVDCGGKPLIYVFRSLQPRIVLFGARLPVETPLFYAHPRELVTLNATQAGGDITVLARERYGIPITDPVIVPPRVAELVAALADRPTRDEARRVRGVGLSMSQVVHVLDALCRDGSIDARLLMEEVDLDRLFGPGEAPGRPEAEQTDEAPPPPDSAEDQLEPRHQENEVDPDRR